MMNGICVFVEAASCPWWSWTQICASSFVGLHYAWGEGEVAFLITKTQDQIGFVPWKGWLKFGDENKTQAC